MNEICCNICEFEDQALQILDDDIADYYQGGATGEQTLGNNRKAFSKLRLRPRVMTNVKERDSSLTVLGQRHMCPVGISPTAMQKLAHTEGEVATAAAAASMDAIMILSILSTSSLEQVSQENPKATLWMQLYIFKERNLTLDLVHRAEAAGYKAIVLTMDTAVLGSRYRDLKNKFTMPPYLTLENFRNIKQNNENLSKLPIPGECRTGLTDYISNQFDDSVSWDDVRWLVRSTKLPVICKGILTGHDALLCYQAGAKAILVSNHGGRQLDQTPATIEALPEVVQAVGDRIEVYMDGGIRYGTDIFKAVGLGAKYVFIGRAALYGLAHSGCKGVMKVLQILNFEFDQTLALCGCNSSKDITPDMIRHKRYYESLLQNSSSKSLKTSRSPKKYESHTKISLDYETKNEKNTEDTKQKEKVHVEAEVDIHKKKKNYFGFKATPEIRKEKMKSKLPRKYCSYVYNKKIERQKQSEQKFCQKKVPNEQKSGDIIIIVPKVKDKVSSSFQNLRLKLNDKSQRLKKVTIVSPTKLLESEENSNDSSVCCEHDENDECSSQGSSHHSQQIYIEKTCTCDRRNYLNPINNNVHDTNGTSQKAGTPQQSKHDCISCGNQILRKHCHNRCSRNTTSPGSCIVNFSKTHAERNSNRFSCGIKRSTSISVATSPRSPSNQFPRRLLRRIQNKF